jgi:prepilin-type N-terminal cleavage/methylation domain-containing protein
MINFKRNKGFTLIELLVVISIIGVMSSIVLSALTSARTKAQDAKAQAEVHQIQLSLANYYSDHGGYPNPVPGTPTTYCIGSTDCLYANDGPYTNINTVSGFTYNAPPEKKSNFLAAVFPAFGNNGFSFTDSQGRVTRGYIYSSCGTNTPYCEETTGEDAAFVVYPKSSGVKTQYAGSSNDESLAVCTNSLANNNGQFGNCTFYNCTDPNANNENDHDGACRYDNCTDDNYVNYNQNNGACTELINCNDANANNNGSGNGKCTYDNCADDNYVNYNQNNGACSGLVNCTDGGANNYNYSNGKCTYDNCTDDNYVNYNLSNGACSTLINCTDPSANNNGAGNGKCTYDPVYCTDMNANNYGSQGSCTYDNCTDDNYVNYNQSNGACSTLINCTDEAANNYNYSNGKCTYN